jgi:hypothetical protein
MRAALALLAGDARSAFAHLCLASRPEIFDPTIGLRPVFWDEMPQAQQQLELLVMGGADNGRRS